MCAKEHCLRIQYTLDAQDSEAGTVKTKLKGKEEPARLH
jgi:hypothetical protein